METPPVVLLHGMWGTGQTLDPVRIALEARGYRVHAPTLPFHPPATSAEEEQLGRTSLLEYARHLEESILAAGFTTPPVLIGHSMGGLLAQILSARLATRATVLLAPAPPAGVQAVRLSNLRATRNVITTPAFWRRTHLPPDNLADWGLLHEVAEPRRSAIRATLLPESGRAYAEIVFWWMDRRNASLVDASCVICPMLIMTGAEDRVIPASVVRKIAERYPQSELQVLPGRGHWFFEEQRADEALLRLGAWLDLVCLTTEPNGTPLAGHSAPAGNASPASTASARRRSRSEPRIRT